MSAPRRQPAPVIPAQAGISSGASPVIPAQAGISSGTLPTAVPTSVGTTGHGATEVAAGPFGEWLNEARAALLGDAGSNVPCGDCVGCCVSSYFIPVRPQDTGAIARIPPELLVRAPGAGGGNAMLGYREDGTCPMLQAGKCSIYADRPQTCRDYDCRIFAAAGIDAGGEDKHVINRRVRAWRFTYPTDAERKTHDAIRAAAAFIRDKKASFPGGRAPTAPTGIAVLALKAHMVFLDPRLPTLRDEDIAAAIIAASREFDAGMKP
jgi:Fe-S-cluster containining protein